MQIHPIEEQHNEAEERFGRLTFANQNGECYPLMSDEELSQLNREAEATWVWRRTANHSDGAAAIVAKRTRDEMARRA